MKQFSDLFEYETCVSVITQTPEILFCNVRLVSSILTHKGAYIKDTEFYEVYYDVPEGLMTFINEDFTTEFEINVRVEQDL